MNVREIAYRVLRIVEKKGFLPRNELDPALSHMDGRDRAFLKELVWGVLRRRVYLDWLVNSYLRNPEIPPSIRTALRLGAYQILFMDGVPDYAAVSETVSLVRDGSFRRLVNAVLRRIARDGYREPDDVCVLFSHPRWICEDLLERFGEDIAARIMGNHLKPSPLVLRVNTLKITRNELMRELADMGLPHWETPHSPHGVVVEFNGPVHELGPVGMGHAIVQGESSQLVSFVLDPKPGETVLDACASPGGKATHIAQLMGDEGRVIAVDVSFDRIRKVVENAELLGLKSIETAIADARNVHEIFRENFDRVLVDAPCTSLGTARKNPEVLQRVGRKDVEKLSKLQVELLESVWNVLKRGGFLLYSVCTFTEEETRGVVTEFLKNHDDARVVDTRDRFGEFGVEGIWDGVGFLMLPDETLSEFYVSLLKKG